MALADLLKIPSVQAYLLDESIYDVFEDILGKYHAEQAHRSSEFLDLTDAVIDGQLPIGQMPALIAQAFGVDDNVARRIACDVAGARLLPLEDFVPGVRDAITGWGGSPEAYAVTKIGKAKMTVENFGNRIADQLGFDFSEVLVKRMGYLVKGYFAGERTRDSALTFFGRASSIGGLGLSAEDAQRLMAAVDDMKATVQIVEPEEITEPAEIVPREQEEVSEDADLLLPEIAPSHEVTTDVPLTARPKVAPVRVLTQEEEIDPQHVRAANRLGRMAEPANTALDGAVADVVAAARTLIAQRKIDQSALEDIARAYVKGIRDLFASREQLIRGFSLDETDLEVLTDALEKALKSYQQPKGDVPAVAVASAPENHVSDAQVLNQRFAAMTRKMPAKPVEPVLPGARVSAARSPEEEAALQSQKIDPEQLNVARVAARPAPVKPQLTVGSVPPPSIGGPKVVTDVRSTVRLMGPIDQLGALTPADFRRLSTAPAEAVQKLDDLFAALEKQSYDDRIKGVKAWRKSPLNQLYLIMASEALKTGVGIAEVAGRRRAAGEESLSPAEVRAIAALNERIRF